MCEGPSHPGDRLLLVVEVELIDHTSRERCPKMNSIAILEKDGKEFFLMIPIKRNDMSFSIELLFDK